MCFCFQESISSTTKLEDVVKAEEQVCVGKFSQISCVSKTEIALTTTRVVLVNATVFLMAVPTHI